MKQRLNGEAGEAMQERETSKSKNRGAHAPKGGVVILRMRDGTTHAQYIPTAFPPTVTRVPSTARVGRSAPRVAATVRHRHCHCPCTRPTAAGSNSNSQQRRRRARQLPASASAGQQRSRGSRRQPRRPSVSSSAATTYTPSSLVCSSSRSSAAAPVATLRTWHGQGRRRSRDRPKSCSWLGHWLTRS